MKLVIGLQLAAMTATDWVSNRLERDESGQEMLEVALFIVLLVLGIVAAVVLANYLKL